MNLISGCPINNTLFELEMLGLNPCLAKRMEVYCMKSLAIYVICNLTALLVFNIDRNLLKKCGDWLTNNVS